MAEPTRFRSRSIAVTLLRSWPGLLGTALVVYGVLIVAGQIVFWLRFGAWMEVPASTLWWHWMRALDNPFPLSIVPDIADPAFTPDALRALRPGGSLEARETALWFLDLPLALYPVVAGASCILPRLRAALRACAQAGMRGTRQTLP